MNLKTNVTTVSLETFDNEKRNFVLFRLIWILVVERKPDYSLDSIVPFNYGVIDLFVGLCVSTNVKTNGPRFRRSRCSTILVNLPLKLFNDLQLTSNRNSHSLSAFNVRILSGVRKYLKWKSLGLSKRSTSQFLLREYRNSPSHLFFGKDLVGSRKSYCFWMKVHFSGILEA